MTAALLDANVLYSSMLRDLLMHLAVEFVFQPKWTPRIHNEWMNSLLEKRPDLRRAQLERTRALMEQWGRDWAVPDYGRIISSLSMPDDNDRHVLAAAIAGEVTIIVTFNLADFPKTTLAPFGIRALHPDVFLTELLEETTDAFIAAVRTHRASLKNPALTAGQYLAGIDRVGLRETSATLKSYRHQI